jgi:tetratricopeptide (TPR) repeat protein
MFLEKRVYQGSSGCVYPLPFIDRIAAEAVEHSWQAAHIENEFLRVMVLPEIGGRIHIGMDKTNGYDFFYRQNVIKPALVGLAGPWISGGVEFNWPQHHRPATFMPVQILLQEHEDGSRTIWCSDHDPMNRLKGMHGICLHPGKAYVELKVQLYNRTPFTQTFLWWANAAVHVHELYQSFFPPDVQHVADHAKRAVSRFPLCDGLYYGINYGTRAKSGVPVDEKPNKFIPQGNYAPNDLSWYANIPVPTSYMALDSSEDFLGGYDHKRRAGVVHVADHHIAPGKKQWTWGNHEFGYAWDRNLTDEDGPYIELMAGVFTDNQPDFSFLGPWETRTFSQYWYPIQEIGAVRWANQDAALSLRVMDGKARVGICTTQAFPHARVLLATKSLQVRRVWVLDLVPGKPFVETCEIPQHCLDTDFEVVVERNDGRKILCYAPRRISDRPLPPPATEPLLPEQIPGNDDLYVTGLHLDQYRHATRNPEAYWLEALRRDPGDSRCSNAMGIWHLRRGEFEAAREFFRRAIGRVTERNPNPRDGEPYYNLGLTLRYLDRDQESYDAFYKATWNAAWQAAAFLELAELDVKRNHWGPAIGHLRSSLRTNSENSNARNLAVVALRALGQEADAARLLDETLLLDPLDCWARYLKTNSQPKDNQLVLDLAFDYARSGLFREAIEILNRANRNANDGTVPIVLYALAHFDRLIGDTTGAERISLEAAQVSPDYCFPSRLEELIILRAAIVANPRDARAPYYLGNLLYDRRRHREAISLWEQSARLDPSFSVVWRNLGIGYFNVTGDVARARSAFDKAIEVAPADARVLYERDQLWKRLGESPSRRLPELEQHAELVSLRDDLSVELVSLYNQTRQHNEALKVLERRRFQPWEGGEGLALGQHVRTHISLGKEELSRGNAAGAGEFFEAALNAPENLGEAKHLLADYSDVYFWLGTAFQALGHDADARQSWEHAAHHKGDFDEMSVRKFSEMTYYKALALKRLNRTGEAEELLSALLAYAETLAKQETKTDYFATSLPAMLLFNDDPQRRNTVTGLFLQAQAWLGLGDRDKAQQLITQVVELDRNHPLAADLLSDIDLSCFSVSAPTQSGGKSSQ